MTRDYQFDGPITTADAFDTVLGQLISAAVKNGVNPLGTREYRNDGTGPDLEVLVVELEKRDGTD